MSKPHHIAWVFNRGLLRIGIVLLFVVVMLYAGTSLFRLTSNSLNISIAGFVMLLALANGFFAFARSIDEDKDLRDKISFCGERALQGALCLLVATIVKWGFLEYQQFLGDVYQAGLIYRIQSILCTMIVTLFFFAGIVESHRALDTVFIILEDRRNRRTDVSK